jgi:hypothetical protein
MAGKWLELLTEIAPGTKRAVMIFNPDTASASGLGAGCPNQAGTALNFWSLTVFRSIKGHPDGLTGDHA